MPALSAAISKRSGMVPSLHSIRQCSNNVFYAKGRCLESVGVLIETISRPEIGLLSIQISPLISDRDLAQSECINLINTDVIESVILVQLNLS